MFGDGNHSQPQSSDCCPSWWVGLNKVPGLAQASLECNSGGAEGEDLSLNAAP